jgi:hypothetical protein
MSGLNISISGKVLAITIDVFLYTYPYRTFNSRRSGWVRSFCEVICRGKNTEIDIFSTFYPKKIEIGN